MPTYEYRCQACNRTVTLRLSITQHEKARQGLSGGRTRRPCPSSADP